MRSVAVLLIALFMAFATPCHAEKPIEVYLLQSPENAGEGHNSRLLELALSKTGKPYKVIIDTADASQLRRIEHVKESNDNYVMTMGASPEHEKDMLAVHVPVLLGIGSGHRVMLTNKRTAAKLASVSTLEELKDFTFVQGLGWSDVEILQAAGLDVTEVYKGELAYRMIDANRVDLFPRGLFEAYSEYAIRKDKYKNLMVEERILLTYPFAFFFYVNKDNQRLHDDILHGMKAAYASGELQDIITTNPTFSQSLDEAHLENRVRMDLPAINISPETLDAIKRFPFVPGKPLGAPPAGS
ncbi:amino acid ABC transporter substrate-binding protein [Pseudodesulfovibrio sp. zrk46]|uniref:amino acid ABC transporter substrate-binding protein n=1 Tax=Pseudodesulfovibrio sp. zrk46 TaxID=2725288 RepID=UPI001448E8B1|nr:amino acid ABC transporter substrate-binding protein [Pseudodesulfovibrio sp. zrk46]QJB55083.1 amino acid ABC transporter substrate-binding protein [Pseudodesulfovibrio sp. zrk46]